MTDTSRRQIIKVAAGVAGVAAVGVGVASCGSDSSNTGANVDQNAGDVNDLQKQQEKQTITPYNAIKSKPATAYPAGLLTDSLELRNLREKLLRFNDPSKLGWAYLFTLGQLVAVLPVKGKISSTQSMMTSSTGVYKSANGSNNGGGGNVPVELPSDDLSFGPNEGGQAGKFFFTPDDVMVFWDGPILYVDAPLNVLAQTAVLEYNKGSKPSNTAPAPAPRV